MAITISQQTIYNTRSGTHASKSTNIRHNEGHKTPLHQALKLHGEGKRKEVINNANAFKVSVSYSPVKSFAQYFVVLPTNIRSGVFVTLYDVYVDNLDNIRRCNFSQNEFHGTAISVTNHNILRKQNRTTAPRGIARVMNMCTHNARGTDLQSFSETGREWIFPNSWLLFYGGNPHTRCAKPSGHGGGQN